MATVSFAGYSYRLGDDGIIVFDRALLTFSATGGALSFSYTLAEDVGLFSPIDFNPESFDRAFVTTGDIEVSLLQPDLLFYIGTYFWDGAAGSGVAQIFDVTTSPISGYVFNFDGTALPDLLNPDVAALWYASINDYRLIDSGALAIGGTVAFRTLDHALMNYGEVIGGTLGDDTLEGGGGSDLLQGFGGSDFLFGRGGDDKLRGGAGGDHLYGGTGDDVLRGGRGADWLVPEAGNDRVWGGPGADHFLFKASDAGGVNRIRDFTPGLDRLVIDGPNSLSDIAISEVSRGLRLAFEDTVIVLAGLRVQDVSADDFLFL